VIAQKDVDLQLPSGRLRARRFGPEDAPLVLGVPGLTSNLVSLTAIAEVQPMLALDLRGRGFSETTGPGTYGWDAHAQDLLAVADRLGAERFAIVGWSMGAFVAMATAAQAPERVERLVLIDALGEVDEVVVNLIRMSVNRLGAVYPSLEAYLELVRSTGLVTPWNALWERVFEYELRPVPGGVSARTDRAAVNEDFEYSQTHDPTRYWSALTMPVLLLRAARPLLESAGGVLVPPAVRDRFRAEVPQATVIEIDANHYGIGAHPDTVRAVRAFFAPS